MITSDTRAAIYDACQANGWSVTFNGYRDGDRVFEAIRAGYRVTVRFSDPRYWPRRRPGVTAAQRSRNGQPLDTATGTGKRETVLDWLYRTKP